FIVCVYAINSGISYQIYWFVVYGAESLCDGKIMSLSFANVSKTQAGQALFTGATCQINPGEKVGLVGPNGAGKTTLFRMIMGEEKPDEGQISTSEGLRVAYFSQNVGEMAGKSALQEVIEGDANIAKLKTQLTEFENKLCDP